MERATFHANYVATEKIELLISDATDFPHLLSHYEYLKKCIDETYSVKSSVDFGQTNIEELEDI